MPSEFAGRLLDRLFDQVARNANPLALVIYVRPFFLRALSASSCLNTTPVLSKTSSNLNLGKLSLIKILALVPQVGIERISVFTWQTDLQKNCRSQS